MISENTTTTDPFAERFRTITDRIRDQFAGLGVFIRPYLDPSLPYFSRFAREDKEILLSHLETYSSLITEYGAAKKCIFEKNYDLTFDFLKKSGIQWADDLISLLENDDYVAAYNHRQQIIYISPNHLKLMSHTIESLYCRLWTDLFQRNELITKILLSRVIEFAQGQHSGSRSNSDVPPHFIEEVGSPESRMATCRPRFYSPLFREGKPSGFLASNRCLFTANRVMPQ